MIYDNNGLYVHGKVKSPCLHCERRFVGCHSTCDDYKAYTDKLRQLREKNFKPHLTYNKTKF